MSSGTDVKRFIACTLIHAQHGFGAVAKATIAALHWLKDNGFIRSGLGTSTFLSASLRAPCPTAFVLVAGCAVSPLQNAADTPAT